MKKRRKISNLAKIPFAIILLGIIVVLIGRYLGDSGFRFLGSMALGQGIALILITIKDGDFSD